MKKDEKAKEPLGALQLVPRPKAPTDPLFTVLIATGKVVLGIRAILVTGKGVVTPDRKNPNTSLKSEQAYSLYSSEAKTYLKVTVFDKGIKSNSRTLASKVPNGVLARASNWGSPAPQSPSKQNISGETEEKPSLILLPAIAKS